MPTDLGILLIRGGIIPPLLGGGGGGGGVRRTKLLKKLYIPNCKISLAFFVLMDSVTEVPRVNSLKNS